MTIGIAGCNHGLEKQVAVEMNASIGMVLLLLSAASLRSRQVLNQPIFPLALQDKTELFGRAEITLRISLIFAPHRKAQTLSS